MFPVFHFQVRVSEADVETGVFSLVITSWLYGGESESNSQSLSVYSSRGCTRMDVSVLSPPKARVLSPPLLVHKNCWLRFETLQPFPTLLLMILLSGCWEWEGDGGA